MALPFFAVTLFVSAFLLFLVQPMIGKMILPKLGGTPQVWNTCMVFFQTALLIGYSYTHFVSTRLTLRRQLVLHGIMLAVPLLFLFPSPFNVVGWTPPAGINPIWETLRLLAFVVGVPFLIVSTSAPLLQKWFASTGHSAASDPYFLYGASNLGSLLSLLAYPLFVEPMIALQGQALTWAVAYVVLAGLVIGCALMVWKSAPPVVQLAGLPAEDLVLPPQAREETPPPSAPQTAVKAGPAPSVAKTGFTRKKGLKVPGKPSAPAPLPTPDISQPRTDEVTWLRRIRWILLAFAPSSLMLGVTSYVSVDVSPFPLLWVIPLSLYLLSFILVFAKWPIPWVGTPHSVMLFLQPFLLCALAYFVLSRRFDVFWATFVSFSGFFVVALVCHGEMARDRPQTKHLTEFFLLMSVGGALGGWFNALIAPTIFTGVAEYPIAIIAACFLRPTQKKDGWFDELLLSAFPSLGPSVRETGDKVAQGFGLPAPRSNWILNVALDIFLALFVLGLAFFIKEKAHGSWGWMSGDDSKNGLLRFLRNILGFSKQSAAEFHPKAYAIGLYFVPMIFIIMFGFGRSLRFGLAMAALFFVHLYISDRDANLVHADRSYFGVLRVLEEPELVRDQEISGAFGKEAVYTYLMHGTTYHGRNYHEPPDLRRLATTYYHRKGPVGVVMERFNWFKGPQNTFWADTRLPASMAGLGAAPLGVGNLPLEQLMNVWSEPPYATIGLGSGTMASYGRWLQHVAYYEIDDKIRNFSLPPNDDLLFKGRDPYFTYLVDAIGRGANLEVIMGDARLSMAQEDPKVSNLYSKPKHKGDFFNKHEILDKSFSNREHYYKVIVVDAFSSDAIPLHLLTKEAVALYFSKLSQDGVICLHTSNRHMDLVMPATDIAKALRKVYIVGNDVGDRVASLGHFGSEYVLLANEEKYLRTDIMPGTKIRWSTPRAPGMRVWTDDYSNIISILR
ncbi:MAG: hypothetical protein L0Y72_24960 [Gemmataceae bacterium]|nr:hypothetical protein [Gemmataceae bacterium]MCI0742295.1 hypothetical protein [Gemmataceae bacterium]